MAISLDGKVFAITLDADREMLNHVWNYATAVANLFPELEITMRNVEFNVELDDDGCMPFVQENVWEKADGI